METPLSAPLKKFEVTVYYTGSETLFVEAASHQEARAIARDRAQSPCDSAVIDDVDATEMSALRIASCGLTETDWERAEAPTEA